MTIRCLGWASDLMLMRGVSEVLFRHGYTVVRTPTEPTFWFGNFVMFTTCPDDPSDQIAAFEAEFPDAGHKLIVWDDPSMIFGAGHDALEKLGYEIDRADVLTLTAPLKRTSTPDGIAIRPIQSDADWMAVVDLQHETGLTDHHDTANYRTYVETRFATIRQQCAAGVSRWFGAWDGDVLAGDLGIMCDARMARYRSVETRASYRRRGICPALLCAAHDWALTQHPATTPIIVAMADSDAGRIYRRCGFVLHEVNVSAVLKGY